MERDMNELRQELVPAAEGLQRVAIAGAATGIEEQRAIAEIRGAMQLAKMYPRDPQEAFQRIMKTCQISAVAEDAEFAFPRGGKTVRGPSIRLAEVIAGAWGNMRFGITELVRGESESIAMTYAWDLETNTHSFRQFVVPHRRDTTEGGKDLSSDRDIYEHIANMGSRRVRACLLQVIPAYVIDAAIEKSRETVARGLSKIPIEERAHSMVEAFKEFGVAEAQIAKWLKHPINEMIEKEFIDLRSIYKTIKDGMGRAEDYFDKSTIAEKVADGKKSARVAGGKAAEAAAGGAPAAGGDEPAREPVRRPTGAGAAVHGASESPGAAVPGGEAPAGGHHDVRGAGVGGPAGLGGPAGVGEASGEVDARSDDDDAVTDISDLVAAAQGAPDVDTINRIIATVKALKDAGGAAPEDLKKVQLACQKRVKELLKLSQTQQRQMSME